MGLDIYCNRLVKTPHCREYRFRLLDEDGNYDNSAFPEWTKRYEKNVTEKWYDWGKYKEQTGVDIERYNIFCEEYGENGHIWQMYPKDKEPEYEQLHKRLHNGEFASGDEYKQALNELVITINAKDVPLKKVVTKCIYYKEVGYQRKGLNSKFYEDFDNGKIEDLVWTLAELERYKKDYCDTDEDKQCFQENIINKFVEGKCVVEFSW